jgi:DNA-binding GntR family transcriptional regulator
MADEAKDDSLRPRTAAEAVAERLRVEIQRGDSPPGKRLRQGEIAERFGVSTTPVREAFALLQADGLVEIDRHRGAVVFRPTGEDVRNSYEVREALEMLAVGNAIPHLSTEVLDDLQVLIDEMRETEDMDRWIAMNNHLHLSIYGPAGNPRLVAIIGSQRDAAAPYIRLRIGDERTRRRSDDQHQEILDACRARDVERAQVAVRVHLEETVEDVVDYLEHHPELTASWLEGGEKRRD